MRRNWLLVLAVACASPPDTKTTTVGAEGGDVSAGGATVDIPAGALMSDVEITVGEQSSSAMPAMPDGAEMPDTVSAFLPHGTQFALPVTVTVSYDGEDTGRAVMRLDDENDSEWEVVGCATFAGGKAKFTTMRFSFYAVASVDCASPPTSDDGPGDDPADPADPIPSVDASQSPPPDYGKSTRDGCGGDESPDDPPDPIPPDSDADASPPASRKAVRSLFQVACCDGGIGDSPSGDDDRPSDPADPGADASLPSPPGPDGSDSADDASLPSPPGPDADPGDTAPDASPPPVVAT